jgi:hypothetical protein
MSLGEARPELRRVCEDVYAYLQPDGGWYLNNTGLSGATIIGHERCREAILSSPMPLLPGIWSDVDRAYLELDGGERGAPVDLARAFGEMVAYNGGQPLTCHA